MYIFIHSFHYKYNIHIISEVSYKEAIDKGFTYSIEYVF